MQGSPLRLARADSPLPEVGRGRARVGPGPAWLTKRGLPLPPGSAGRPECSVPNDGAGLARSGQWFPAPGSRVPVLGRGGCPEPPQRGRNGGNADGAAALAGGAGEEGKEPGGPEGEGGRPHSLRSEAPLPRGRMLCPRRLFKGVSERSQGLRRVRVRACVCVCGCACVRVGACLCACTCVWLPWRPARRTTEGDRPGELVPGRGGAGSRRT